MDSAIVSASPAVLTDKSSVTNAVVAETPAAPKTAPSGGDTASASRSECHNVSLGSEASTPGREYSGSVVHTLEDFDIGSQLGRGKFGKRAVISCQSTFMCQRLIVQRLCHIVHRFLAHGSSGHVFKVREKKTKHILAMKVMLKKEIKARIPGGCGDCMAA
jgi:hypothetical protein